MYVYFQQNKKKRRRSRKGKCHTITMMSTITNKRLTQNTQHVAAEAGHGGKSTREGVRSGVGRRVNSERNPTDETRNRYERSR
jgi:hypothetical protein